MNYGKDIPNSIDDSIDEVLEINLFLLISLNLILSEC